MENNHNWNGTRDGADPQQQWQSAENNEGQWLHAEAYEEDAPDYSLDAGDEAEDAEVLYAGGRDEDEDEDEDEVDDDDDEDDNEDMEDDDDDDDLDDVDEEPADWGNVDPQANSGPFPTDNDPSGPGSAV